jgi:hypothetical protein
LPQHLPPYHSMLKLIQILLNQQLKVFSFYEVAISFFMFHWFTFCVCKKGDLPFHLFFSFFVRLWWCDETDVNIGIDIPMSYASQDSQSPFSNAHTPLCSMYFSPYPLWFTLSFCFSCWYLNFLYSASSAEMQSDDVSNTGPSTIDKRKRKKRYAKKPCNSEGRLNLIVDHSAEIFTISMLVKCCLKILRNQERQCEHRLPNLFTYQER